MMNPKSTNSQVRSLIGRNFSESDVQEELGCLPFETLEGPGGEILVHLQYMGETHMFLPVQILAMLFAHLKHAAEKNMETTVSDCVIGIPAYFTYFQRRANLNAAAIAGLKPLKLMDDSTATVLGYGIYKNDNSNTGPTNVVFVDIAYGETQLWVASFQTGHMISLSNVFDHLGWKDCDEDLFSHFTAQLKEQYNMDVWARIRI
eukprot:TRINITY_DN9722_c0_g1_i10.p1 TRINITY_DN9722_c0_g1~~TRINITY_DN9722_c0_g1_i10.p1  ORF type:complete len:204 (-),score=39.85 TRINITY_DN9722_c0_g1_i10:98-709(-)